MSYFLWIAGAILALAWFSRIVDAALGMPHVADIAKPEWDRKLAGEPRISIIVPARNEQEHIREALTQLLELDYSNYEVIAVNDRSTDRTGAIMDEIAASREAHGKLRILHVTDLPPRWLGKTHAMWTSGQQAIGTYPALRMEVLDDMKLGKVIKNAGFAPRVVFGDDLVSLRWAKGAFGVVNNLTKNFFALLSFQWWRTIASVIGVGFLNLGPFLGVSLTHGWLRLPYGVALLSILAIYFGMSNRSDVRPYYFFLHPVATALFMYALMRSMFHALWHDGVIWRGTRYPLDELR